MRQMLDNPYPRPSRIVSQKLLDVFYWPHSCDLWKPGPLVLDANKVAADPVYILAIPGQKCAAVQTSETDVPGAAGRSKAVNIFTLDHILFPTGCPIEDTWVVVFRSPSSDMSGSVWMVQGNPQPQVAVPFHLVETQLVYGKVCPAPLGVQ